MTDHRSSEDQAKARELAAASDRLAQAINDWAQPDEELGWEGDDVLRDIGNCDDLAAFLWDRGLFP